MAEIIAPSHIAFGVDARKKKESLALLSAESLRLGLAEDEKAVLEAYNLREEEGVTGLIEGFSVPHAKSSAIKRAGVLIQTFKNPIEDWETLDGSKVSYAISLLVPADEAGDTHIKLLSRVAVMIMDKDFRDAFRGAGGAEEIAGLISSRLASD